MSSIQAAYLLSSIFSIISKDIDGVTNKIGLFGKSVQSIHRDFASGHGILGSIFKSTVTQDDINRYIDFTNQIKSGIPIGQAWANSMAGATVAGKQMVLAIKSGDKTLADFQTGVTESQVALSNFKATLANIGVSLAISLIVAGISKIKQAREEARQAVYTTASESAEEIDKITELYSSYQSAKTAYESNAGSKSDLTNATDELLKALGVERSEVQGLAGDYGALGGKIDEATKKALEDDRQKQNRSAKKKQEEISDEFGTGFGDLLFDNMGHGNVRGFGGLYNVDEKEESKIKKVLENHFGKIDDNGVVDNYDDSFEGIKKQYEKLTQYRNVLIEEVNNGIITQDELNNSVLYDEISDQIAQVEKLFSEYQGYIDRINEDTAKLKFFDYLANGGQIPKTKDEYDNLKQSIIEAGNANKEFQGSEQDIANVVDEALKGLPQLKNFFDNVNLEEPVKATKEQLEELKDEFKDNSISEWFNSLSDDDKQLVYDISVRSDDTTLWTLTKWKNELETVKATSMTSEESLQKFYDALNSSDEGNLSDKIKNYVSGISSLKEALSKIELGSMTKDDLISLAIDFPQLAPYVNDTDSLKTAIRDLINTSESGMSDEIESQIETLGIKGTVAADALYGLKTMLEDVSAVNFNIDDEIEQFNNLYAAMKNSVTGTGLTQDDIDKIKAKYSDLAGYDASALFEKTEHGVHLNTNALRALESEYTSLKKLQIQNNLKDLKQQYNDSCKAVEGLTEGTEEYNKALQDKGFDTPQSILSQIEDTQTLAVQYEGLTSAYNKWVLAQSSGEEGDMYDNITSSLENLKQLYDDGLVGTNAFRSAVQLMSDEDLSTASVDELVAVYESGYSAMQRYFTEGQDGAVTFLEDIQKINSEWANVNEDGQWDINFGIGNDEEIAQALSKMSGLKVSTEEVQIIMRKLSDFGFDIKLDSAYTSVDELKSRIEDSEESLKKLGQNPVQINIDTNDFDSEIEKAQNLIEQIKNSDTSPNIKTAQLEDANNKLDILISKKLELSQPSFMSLSSSDVDQSLSGTLTLLQQYQNAVDRQYTMYIKGDTSGMVSAKKEVDELTNKIASLDDDTLKQIGITVNTNDIQARINSIKTQISNDKVTFGVSVDTNEVQNKVQESIGNTTVETKVNVNVVGNELVDNLNSALNNIHDKSITITANTNGQNKVNTLLTSTQRLSNKTIKATAKVIGTDLVNLLKSAIDRLHDKTVRVGANVFGTESVKTLKYRIDELHNKTITTTNITKTKAGVDGTAYSNGIAFERGNWGTKESGIALGGERGAELIVRNGKFFTIGDNSAEFFRYKKNDIIFNADQTEQIFKYGKIIAGNKRGKAFVEGTAFSSGSGKFIKKSSSSSSSRNSSSSSGANSSSGSSSNSSSGNSSSSSKDFKEVFDWVEVAIKRIERTVNLLDSQSNNSYQSWNYRNKKLKTEISTVGKDIRIQQRGYQKYLQQAKSVGLSANWAKRVHNGTIDINTIKNEKLAEKIKEYQKWYEKAVDCKDAISKLREQESALYKTAFDNVSNKYDDILNILEHRGSMIQENISQAEQRGRVVSNQYYMALYANEKNNIDKLTKERNELIVALRNGLKSGTIKQGSQEWYEMVNAINSVTLGIKQANTAMMEFSKTIRENNWKVFDLLQEKISYIATEADFLMSLMKNDKLYEDSGQLTTQGMSTMGLHGLNYNTYMIQADKYAKEILNVNKQLAKDPYNQDIAQRRQELIELQQKSILAAEDEKEAIRNMVKEGIELELSSLKKLIDKYEDTLDVQKNLYDYQKKTKEQTKEIASLEKQIAAYSGDTSEETKSKIQQLQVSLSEAKQDLEETQYDKYLNDQKKLVDNLYNEYESILNQRLDDIDTLISDMINDINNNSDAIRNTLSIEAKNVGYSLSNDMNKVWNSNGNKNAVAVYGDKSNFSSTTINGVVGTISTNVAKMVNQLNKLANTQINNASKVEANKITTNGKTAKSYKTGIYDITKSQLAWTQENGVPEAIVRPSDGAILTPLAKGDSVLNGVATNNLFSLMSDPTEFIRENILTNNNSSVPSVVNSSNNTSVTLENVNISLPNVKNYDDFLYAMQHDKKFEKLVRAISVDRVFGGSSLNKYHL